MVKLFLSSITAVALMIATPALADYTSYKNPTFGTTISFPDTLFEWEEELQSNQTGMLFSSDDGGTLAVFAYESSPDITPKDIATSIRENTNENFNITYERITKNWMVQSGYQGDLIYYQRVEFSRAGNIHGMLLKYPKQLRGKYDKHIGNIARSLRGN